MKALYSNASIGKKVQNMLLGVRIDLAFSSHVSIFLDCHEVFPYLLDAPPLSAIMSSSLPCFFRSLSPQHTSNRTEKSTIHSSWPSEYEKHVGGSRPTLTGYPDSECQKRWGARQRSHEHRRLLPRPIDGTGRSFCLASWSA